MGFYRSTFAPSRSTKSKAFKPAGSPTSTSKGTKSNRTSASGTKVTKGPGHVSSFDNAWHPASWYAPKGDKAVVKKAAASAAPPGVKPVVRGKDPAKIAAIVKRTMSTIKANNTPANQAANRGKAAGKVLVDKTKPGTTTTSRPTTTTRTSGSGGGGGTTTTPTTPTTPPKPPATPAPPKPPPTTTTPSKPTTASNFTTLSGYGKSSKFANRRRGGPRQSLSITPDMLQRIAQQRIVRYR